MHKQSSVQRAVLAAWLQAQADGDRAVEASIIIVTRAVRGQLLDAVTLAWSDNDRGMAEIDWDATRTSTGYLSGGERRLLALAGSLGSGHAVDLADALTGLDDHNARVVITAVAHATGLVTPNAWKSPR